MRILAATVLATAVAVGAVQAQQQTQRVRGVIEKVDGNTLLIKAAAGEVALTLTDDALVVGVVVVAALLWLVTEVLAAPPPAADQVP